MKKRLTALLTALLLIMPLSGCKAGIKTELAMKNIKSMICTEQGNMYLLSDKGLRVYNLGADKKLEYLYDRDDLENAEFDWINGGEEIIYSDLRIERLMALGEDGVNMVGKYAANNLGRETQLFVLQDAYDLNYGAAYFTEIENCEGGFVNGAASDGSGVYFKLNCGGESYRSGMYYSFFGQTSPRAIPDGVTGAIKTGEKTAVFLVETDERLELSDGEKTVKSFDRAKVADAFINGKSVYILYKDGSVTKADADGNETEFKKLGGSLADVNDALLYDGEIYWFDKEGVKTTAK